MKCPICEKDTKVLDSRLIEDGMIVRRRRACISCKNRFSTQEEIETPQFKVKKKDNTIELYSRKKLKKGLEIAFEKRPIKNSDILRIVNLVENDLQNKEETEIKSEYIGSLVLAQLKKIDEVAYLRFASVHKSFDSAEKFKKELQNLKDDK